LYQLHQPPDNSLGYRLCFYALPIQGHINRLA
jgi:hypothetical protein